MNEILCWLWGAATVGGWWLFTGRVKQEEYDEDKVFSLLFCVVLALSFWSVVCGIGWLVDHVYVGVTP